MQAYRHTDIQAGTPSEALETVKGSMDNEKALDIEHWMSKTAYQALGICRTRVI
jgi:hypothetical protein